MDRPLIDGSRARTLAGCLLTALLQACGGSSDGPPSPPPPSTGWVAGLFLPADSFAARCEAPRSGLGSNGQAFRDIQGTVLDENNWLRSWSNDLYLWYDEIVDRDPSNFASTLSYFDALKTTALTTSGNPKDRFHFTYDTAEWQALSQSGVSADSR